MPIRKVDQVSSTVRVTPVDESRKPHAIPSAPHSLVSFELRGLQLAPIDLDGKLIRHRSVKEPDGALILPELADSVDRMPDEDIGSRSGSVIQGAVSPTQRTTPLAAETSTSPLELISSYPCDYCPSPRQYRQTTRFCFEAVHSINLLGERHTVASGNSRRPDTAWRLAANGGCDGT